MSRSLKLSSTSCGTLADQAYHAILDLILRGRLPLGVVVSRRQLAKELGISMLPIAEAAQRLENEGFLESKPQVGTRVRIPSEHYVRDRFLVREALESQSARLFCERADFAQKCELKLMAQQMDTLFNRLATADGDAEFAFAVHQYHLQFHGRIAEYSGCAELAKLIQQDNVLTFNWLYDRITEQPLQPPGFHQQLADALSGADPQTADGAMRLHVRHGVELTVRAVRRLQPALRPKWRLRAPLSKV